MQGLEPRKLFCHGGLRDAPLGRWGHTRPWLGDPACLPVHHSVKSNKYWVLNGVVGFCPCSLTQDNAQGCRACAQSEVNHYKDHNKGLAVLAQAAK